MNDMFLLYTLLDEKMEKDENALGHIAILTIKLPACTNSTML